MEISTLIGTELVSVVNVEDKTDNYDKTVNRTFLNGEELEDGQAIYERTGGTLTPKIFNASDEQDYKIGDIVYKDGELKYVSALTGQEVPTQPENYTGISDSMYRSGWNTRYTKLGDLVNNVWEREVLGIYHKIYYNGSNWVHTLRYLVQEYYDGPREYDGVNFYVRWDGDFARTMYMKHGASEMSAGTQSQPNHYVSASDGNWYKAGYYKKVEGTFKYYEIIRRRSRSVSFTTPEQILTMLSASDPDVTEEKSYCYDTADCDKKWRPRTIIRRGNTLYMRNDRNEDYQMHTVNQITYTPLKTLTDYNGWGWTFVRPSDIYAPLDKKKYTFVDTTGPVEYTVKGVAAYNELGETVSNNQFNTVAINGLVADTVEATFLPDDGSAAIPIIITNPDNRRDKDAILTDTPTTMTAYAPRSITGNIHLKLIGARVRIGGIVLGQGVNAGFTNLVFTNKFKDYSPYEKDKFGNILYIKGVKTNIFTGTVDVLIEEYDMINRLMASIGGETVILNGSDTTNNDNIEDHNFFASTMVVGRIRNFVLRTKLDNKLLAQMATYTFEIEEDI